MNEYIFILIGSLSAYFMAGGLLFAVLGVYSGDSSVLWGILLSAPFIIWSIWAVIRVKLKDTQGNGNKTSEDEK